MQKNLPSFQASYNPTTLSLVAAAADLIPQSGATFIGHHDEVTLAHILLAPGDGLDRYNRRLAEHYPNLLASVRGDPGDSRPAPSPDAFHKTTLRWLLCGAEHIALWSAPLSDVMESNRLWVWNTTTLSKTSKWVTIIETTAEKAAEWLRVIGRWKCKATIHHFGPVAVAGLTS
jgi:hypothetical protein